MKADEMAIECARQLKAYCDSQDICEVCAFYTIHGLKRCELAYDPFDWDIPETIGSPTDDDGK